MLLIFLGLTFLCSFALTALLRRYAQARQLIDIPNARSSHAAPTPRGGGVAIVVAALVAWSTLALGLPAGHLPIVALVGAGAAVALIGFLDDHGHIPARWRLLGHFSSIGWGLFWTGSLPSLDIGIMQIQAQWLLWPLALLYGVWMLNLYNFMDGINGIAGIEVVSASLAIGAFALLQDDFAVSGMSLALAASGLGFLLWNFPKARIFMGDAGSGFLGAVLALLSIWSAGYGEAYFWAWLVMLGVFVVDATLTLMRRLARGEKLYEAHRSHAYQYASRRYSSHTKVTCAVLAINLLWLAPVAACIVFLNLPGILGFFIAYLPLVVLAAAFKAGAKGD